jgi:hypothetical protein
MRGDVQNQLKISAPHPMTETYRLIPLLAALISLDSPFDKVMNIYVLPMLLERNIKCTFTRIQKETEMGVPLISFANR